MSFGKGKGKRLAWYISSFEIVSRGKTYPMVPVVVVGGGHLQTRTVRKKFLSPFPFSSAQDILSFLSVRLTSFRSPRLRTWKKREEKNRR